MKAFRKTFLALCLAALMLATCCTWPQAASSDACSQVVDAYFSAFARGDFSYCHTLFTAASRETTPLADFVSRYNNISAGMEIKSISYTQLSIEENSETGGYTALVGLTYHCERLGDVYQQISLSLSQEGASWRIVYHPSLLLTDLDWEDTVAVNTLKPDRGEILDEDGNQYAVNSYADTVYVDLNEVGDYNACAQALAPLVGMDALDILTIMSSERAQADKIALVTYYIPGKLESAQRTLIEAVPGVGVDSSRFTPIRYYPQGATLAHTIGYTTVATAEDLATMDENIYSVDSQIGRSGLEAAYESTLCGRKGVELVIMQPGDEGGFKRKQTVKRVDAVDGQDLIITIDLALQRRAEEELAALGGTPGSVIAIDPATGAVEACAVWPSYDLNIYADRDVSSLYNALLEDPKTPLFNRATQGLYPPGSTVKPLVALMAFDEGKFSLNTEFTGEIVKRQWMPTVNGWVYPAITRATDYLPPYNMRNAIIHSDNIYFANVALTCGWEAIVGLYENIGFGQRIAYDIPVTASRIYSDTSRSNLRLLADMGYGQGQLLVSPLQMASIYTAFTNNGDILSPYIVSSTAQTVNGRYQQTAQFPAAQVAFSDALPEQNLLLMERILIETIDNSSLARTKGLTVAGKTGTAQLDDVQKREIAWIIGYAKHSDYDRLVCVNLEIEADTGEQRYGVFKEMILP